MAVSTETRDLTYLKVVKRVSQDLEFVRTFSDRMENLYLATPGFARNRSQQPETPSSSAIEHFFVSLLLSFSGFVGGGADTTKKYKSREREREAYKEVDLTFINHLSSFSACTKSRNNSANLIRSARKRLSDSFECDSREEEGNDRVESGSGLSG